MYDAALVDGHAIGQPATADEAVRAVADLPAAHLRANVLDDPGDLETRDVGRPAGRGRIGTLALRDVGAVDAGEGSVDQHFLVTTDRIGALLARNDLVSSSSGVDDAAHAALLAIDCSQRTRTRNAAEPEEQ